MNQQYQVGVTFRRSRLLKDLLCFLDSRLNFTIGLMVIGNRCDVLEPLFCGEGFEFSTCAQRTTVRHNFIGNPISSHVCLTFPDHRRSLHVIQPVDLGEAREIIHSHHVTQVVKVKKVCGNFGLKGELERHD